MATEACCHARATRLRLPDVGGNGEVECLFDGEGRVCEEESIGEDSRTGRKKCEGLAVSP